MWESHIFLKKLNYYRAAHTEKPFIILEKVLEPKKIVNDQNIISIIQNSILDTKLKENKEILTFKEDEWSKIVTEDFGMDNFLEYEDKDSGTKLYYMTAPIKDTSTHDDDDESHKIVWTEHPSPNVWEKYRELVKTSTAKNKSGYTSEKNDSSPDSVIPTTTKKFDDTKDTKRKLF
jgi:hypothetical protein